MTRPRIRVGSVVRLTRVQATALPRQWTRVQALLPDVEGGVWLEEPLEWSRGWNVEDLEVRPRRRRRGAR